MQDKSGRIRQGSPEEERALGQHIAALAPSPKQLSEAGQLSELLTLLGMLQKAVTSFCHSLTFLLPVYLAMPGAFPIVGSAQRIMHAVMRLHGG